MGIAAADIAADRVLAQCGAALARRRRELRLSQLALAHRIGATQAAISQVERGKRHNLPLPLLLRIADALGLDGEQLVADALLADNAGGDR